MAKTEKAPPEDAISVLIVDDHALFRRGLRWSSRASPTSRWWRASDGQEAVERAERTSPDVVLMDVRMPKRSGIEATRADQGHAPLTKILC